MATAPESKQVQTAARLVLKLYDLTNQAPLAKEQLQTRAMHWAGALIEAGIPPSKWDAMATLARKARPAASKAFPVTCDQIIDVWAHWLRGEEWYGGGGEYDWGGERRTFVPCGQCEDGKVQGERVNVYQPCGCEIPEPVMRDHGCRARFRTMGHYIFRRFDAAYEIRTGQVYELTEDDIRAFYRLDADPKYFEGQSSMSHVYWRADQAIDIFFGASPAAPTFVEFCATPVLADLRRQKPRQYVRCPRWKEHRLAWKEQWLAEQERELHERRDMLVEVYSHGSGADPYNSEETPF